MAPKHELERDDMVVEKSRERVERPPLFKVLLHNDNYTTMEFVIYVLVEVFGKGETDAFQIMLAVHNEGVGIAGVYPFEIAEAKVAKVTSLARQQEFPLLVTLEEE
jgi:ATP-dependent Clp protease adaptor protein ClpS